MTKTTSKKQYRSMMRRRVRRALNGAVDFFKRASDGQTMGRNWGSALHPRGLVERANIGKRSDDD